MNDTIVNGQGGGLGDSAPWGGLQAALLLVGVAILGALLWEPQLGLHAVWNVLIPAAPALFVFVPGLWRNICPMSTVALLPRTMGFSGKRRMGNRANQALRWGAVVALLAIVPLRHVILDISGLSTAILLVVAAVAAVGMGLVYDWKSGWCSSLCPVQPVELLYGRRPVATFKNARCSACYTCVSSCNDSEQEAALDSSNGSWRLSPVEFLAGGFAGFVWAWFHVPNFNGEQTRLAHLAQAYAMPLGWFVVSLAAYLALRSLLGAASRAPLQRLFATAAVVAYYWYRLPFLFGFSLTPPDGVLVDLTAYLPVWTPWAMRALTTTALVGWMLWPVQARRPWLVRPTRSNGVEVPG